MSTEHEKRDDDGQVVLTLPYCKMQLKHKAEKQLKRIFDVEFHIERFGIRICFLNA